MTKAYKNERYHITYSCHNMAPSVVIKWLNLFISPAGFMKHHIMHSIDVSAQKHNDLFICMLPTDIRH